ncbi:response regulator transcription factor [Streptococcus dysgalactiae]|uniref:response regulator transcription factor n=2 Tax=Streptococcus dysgalactiae TaxID=1334 RepID=UPI0001F86492|nr:response regulator transcription factor [Streptococcus dysgalactiae]EFY02640.1 response regulator protein [Streptococcus dysgalactiae subsp. dysgalactiae ATCC 27957]MCB2829591.1 response regulator transcription factor [Streptococcus dysgalactiae subsp. dysgalactiae]MCB2831758.1 response regulator transcription factor [Streptococcus dysgalactiae subsp. dysgalactiae]MCB2833831.1 response regulator transcription factor [Streptococcus dysgalactiae subsp. dysgalactiae]MCB2835465.1 response regul
MIKHDKIYIIEDDQAILTLLHNHLSQTYDVKTVSNFRDIKQEVLAYQPDLILMDITLPFFNGFYWTTEIRKQSMVPIIFISSSNDETDTIMALHMGGDDFISKPFSLTILDAKIAAFLRRSQQFTSDEISFAQFKLHFDGTLSNGKDSVTLSPTEHKILTILITKNHEIVTKEEILERLWENDNFIDHNTLNVNMTRLRKKIATIGFDHIHTIRGVGYLVK